jgi:hypothetical protein
MMTENREGGDIPSPSNKVDNKDPRTLARNPEKENNGPSQLRYHWCAWIASPYSRRCLGGEEPAQPAGVPPAAIPHGRGACNRRSKKIQTRRVGSTTKMARTHAESSPRGACEKWPQRCWGQGQGSRMPVFGANFFELDTKKFINPERESSECTANRPRLGSSQKKSTTSQKEIENEKEFSRTTA